MNEQTTPAITNEQLNALRTLANTPAEYGSGEHAAAQSQLASHVPMLLDEIDRLRELLQRQEMPS